MKKSLVLAMAMALGVAASAYAANPFSDVPAGHWAYDSISKLAAAGVIEGYGDDTFRGDRLMTRYEMAQIVAKAMAKGANVDRLAAEFASELDALGVRVAALEKKSDNVRITGEARYHYAHVNGKGSLTNDHSTALRSRLWLNGKVNDNWNYVGMLENIQDLSDHVGNEETHFQRAYLDGRLGGLNVKAGRIHKDMVDGNLYEGRMDAVDVSYGDKIRLNAFYGKPSDDNTIANWIGYEEAWGVNASAGLGDKAKLHAGIQEFRDSDVIDNNRVWNAGLDFKLGKDVTLGGMYLKSNLDDKDHDRDGVIAKLEYGGAKANEVGSFGLNAKYYNQGAGTFMGTDYNAHSITDIFADQGFKGYSLGAHYTVAKNMILGAEYYDLKGKEAKEDKARMIWGDLTVTF
jgi:hypothetical protein